MGLRANPGAAGRWVWFVVAILAMILVAGIAFLVRTQNPGQDAAADSLAPGGTSSPSATQTTPTPSATPSQPASTASTEPAASPSSLPLPEPGQRFDGASSFISDAPASDGALQDGGFFAFVKSADAAGHTISVDIAIFYGGQAAIDYVAAHDPAAADEDGSIPNGYYIVNDVERTRVLAVDVTVVPLTWCYTESGAQVLKDWDFISWAAAPALAPTTSCAEPGRQANDTYWVDVRGGVVRQITGQYLP
jgi:hypothetical protein